MQETTSKINILFLCTGNSCRSQMAEGLAKYFWKEKFNIYSAGVDTHGLNQNAVKVMSEVNIDISKNTSKHVETLNDVNFDYVITVCGHANENCPVFSGNAKVIHVGFEDPPKLAKNTNSEEEALNCYRKIRDEIKSFIENLPEELKKRG